MAPIARDPRSGAHGAALESVLARLVAAVAIIVFAAGAHGAGITWEWWRATGSQLMLLGLFLMALASFMRPPR